MAISTFVSSVRSASRSCAIADRYKAGKLGDFASSARCSRSDTSEPRSRGRARRCRRWMACRATCGSVSRLCRRTVCAFARGLASRSFGSAIQHRRPGIRVASRSYPDPGRCAPARGCGHDRRPAGRRYRPALNDVELTRAIHEARRNRDLTDHGLARLYALCPRAVEVFDSEEAPGEASSSTRSRRSWSCAATRSRCSKPTGTDSEVDTYSPDHRLIIELNGYRDHSLPDRFEADRERDELAIALQHATLRITWRRLTRKPGELDRNLRAILAARAPRVIGHGDRDA